MRIEARVVREGGVRGYVVIGGVVGILVCMNT